MTVAATPRLNRPTVGLFEGVFTKLERAADGTVTWKATTSDDGVDVYATRMTTELHEDFIRNAEGSFGMPYLTVSHFDRLARIGRATKLYRDGRRLKAEGVFWTNHDDSFIRAMADAAATAALKESSAMTRFRTIRTSIGFLPEAAVEEDLGVIAYTRGTLHEITLTTHPGNSRVDFLAQEDGDMETRTLKTEFMERDAASIIGEVLAAQLREKLEALGRSADGESPLDLLYRMAESRDRVAIDFVTAPLAVGEDSAQWASFPTQTDPACFATRYAEPEGDDAGLEFLHHGSPDAEGTPVLSPTGLTIASAAATALADAEPAREHLGRHYADIGRTAPWDRSRDDLVHRLEDLIDLDVLTAAGIIDAPRREAARDAFRADFDALVGDDPVSFMQGIANAEIVILDADGNVEEVIVRFGDFEIAAPRPSVSRSGRKMQGAKLAQLKSVLDTLTQASADVNGLIAWAEEVAAAAEDAGDDDAGRMAAAVRAAILDAEGSDPVGPGVSLADLAVVRSRRYAERYMEIDPDSTIEEVQDYQAMTSVVFNTLYTLQDIILANLNPDEDLTLQDRMGNIEGATNEFLSIVNSVLMTSFGEGRSAPADNSPVEINTEPKPSTTRTSVKPAARGSGNPSSTAGTPSEAPNLDAFDAAHAKARAALLAGDVAGAEAAINEAVAAAEDVLPDAETPPVDDALLERVAAVEVTMTNILARIEEVIDGRDAPAPILAVDRAPRRRALRPSIGPGTAPTYSAPDPSTKRNGASIREVAQRTTQRFNAAAFAGEQYP